MNKKILSVFTIVVISLAAMSVSAKSEKGSMNGERHRNEVMKITQELERVADSDNKIRNEVRSVAQEEKDASEVVKEKMNRVENRGKLKSFLIGSDYKNLGQLRSELVTTQNHLDRLNKALDKTASTTIKTDLENQIKELEATKDKAESFIQDNESKFSLFGWLVRLFK